MPISDSSGYEVGHFARVYEHLLKPAIVDAGYFPVRADDTVKTDYIVVNIIRDIVDAEIIVCDLSAKNANVMYELGIRHAFNKPVALIKDRKTDKTFDIQGLRYTEYDESLRIDSVKRDGQKLIEAIKTTAAAGDESINSIVRLAGISAAAVPEKTVISNETNLLLRAISDLDKRISSIEIRPDEGGPYFEIEDDKVHFSDGSSASVSDSVMDFNTKMDGDIKEIDPIKNRIAIKSRKDGKILLYSAFSSKSKGLRFIPF